MTRISLSDAKAQLSDLVARAEKGEEIIILRRGKSVARLSAADSLQEKPGIDIKALRSLTETMPFQEQGAGEFIRAMRDDDRY